MSHGDISRGVQAEETAASQAPSCMCVWHAGGTEDRLVCSQSRE